MELLLSDHPWTLAALYAAEMVACNIVQAYSNAYFNVVTDSSSKSLLTSESSYAQISVVPKFTFRPLVLGVSLLLVTGYWDVVPRSAFSIVIGMTVVSCGCTLLLDNLPILSYWKVLYEKGLRQNRPDRQLWLIRVNGWQIGCAALFGLCWLLTGNLIFLGATISKLISRMTTTDIAD